MKKYKLDFPDLSHEITCTKIRHETSHTTCGITIILERGFRERIDRAKVEYCTFPQRKYRKV